jgi:hypothetical protein
MDCKVLDRNKQHLHILGSLYTVCRSHSQCGTNLDNLLTTSLSGPHFLRYNNLPYS